MTNNRSIPGNDYPGNSRLPRQKSIQDSEKEKPERIAKTTIREEEKPLVVKWFGEGSAMREIARYLIWDVALPAAKDVIVEGLGDAINMIIYGEDSGGRSRRRRNIGRTADRSYVSYNSYYERDRKPKARSERQIVSRRYSFRDVIFENRPDAEDVLSYLAERIDEFGHATVADFFESVGQPSIFTDNNWGWYSVRSAEIKRGRGGIFIEMPKPEPLDD